MVHRRRVRAGERRSEPRRVAGPGGEGLGLDGGGCVTAAFCLFLPLQGGNVWAGIFVKLG